MKVCLRFLICLLLISACRVPSQAKQLAVVVDKSNSTANLTAAELGKILQATTKKWPDGRAITVVVRDIASLDTQEILSHIFKVSPSEVAGLLAEHKSSLVIANSDEMLLKMVATTPGAIGLVDVYSITSRVNVVKVDGKLPLESGYLLH